MSSEATLESIHSPGPCRRPVVLAAGFLLLLTAAAESQPVANTWYRVVNRTSGKCVDAASGGTANGTVVQQWTCNTNLQQQWLFTATTGGYYQVATRNASAQAWDVTNVSTADGAKIQLWAYGGGTNQQWQAVSEAGGFYHFVNRNSGKCLDDTDGSTADGTQLQQWACAGNANQAFSLVVATTTATPTATATVATRATATATPTSRATAGPTPTPAPTSPPSGLSLLHANGRNLVNASGSVVRLNGFNLGGWLVMEKWMCPMDSGGIADTHGVIQTLDSRFGVATEQSLIKTYQQSWTTTADLDNIKNGGYNLVRVPVWWGDFYPISDTSNGAWRADAFDMLDWVVSNAGSRGIYVIIDMHGVIGGQNTADWTGWANQNQYWGNSTFQAETAFMWQKIATHYRGNGTVAGYDLMNEPGGTPSSAVLWGFYNSLYNTIRAADPSHLIIMEGTYGSWNWSMLPPPSQFGWANIMYEMHEYQFNGSATQVMTGTNNQVNDFNNHASWNVPGYVGEWNDFATGTSTWQYTNNAYKNAGLSSSPWSYKAIHGVAPDTWGWYDPNTMPVIPNIANDSATTISNDWLALKGLFSKNAYLGM